MAPSIEAEGPNSLVCFPPFTLPRHPTMPAGHPASNFDVKLYFLQLPGSSQAHILTAFATTSSLGIGAKPARSLARGSRNLSLLHISHPLTVRVSSCHLVHIVSRQCSFVGVCLFFPIFLYVGFIWCILSFLSFLVSLCLFLILLAYSYLSYVM